MAASGEVGPGTCSFPCPGKPLAEESIGEQTLNLIRQVDRVTVARDETGLLVHDHLGNAAGGGAHDGGAGQQRFHQGQTLALPRGRDSEAR